MAVFRASVPRPLIGTAMAGSVLLAACSPAAPAPTPAAPTAPPVSPSAVATSSTPTPTPTPPAPVTITIGYAGDVLTHMPVLDSTPDGDLTELLAPFAPWTSGVDLALCGLEVPQVPPGGEPSGWPLFGMPPAVIASLPSAGWDGCTTASNHSLDQGWQGIVTTLDAAEAAGLGTAGTGRTEIEAPAAQLYQLQRGERTITVAQLAATYDTNGLPLPEQAPWSVVHIDVPQLAKQAELARAAGADVVVLQIQWGTEYQSQPDQNQENLAAELAATGQFDAIFGNHVHVPQPITRLGGGPNGTTWVAYGSGNYVSNQSAECCAYLSPVGLFLVLTVTVPGEPDGAVTTEMTWTAHTTDTDGGHRVYPLAELAAGQFPDATISATEASERLAALVEVMGGDSLQRRAPYTPSGPEPQVVPRPR
ncbi:CapA family protein [Buchananella hordeovulneris]|uniref:CapA family protein n=1 Tax=Buchananella hordeovulneris TaxID=52770 RepID=UPI000F5E7886|nr:CapA family protein [Buchananella hordeovulneris]RRD44045.1 CapA family protein [Buchananella hordeovulneris]